MPSDVLCRASVSNVAFVVRFPKLQLGSKIADGSLQCLETTDSICNIYMLTISASLLWLLVHSCYYIVREVSAQFQII